MHSHAADTSATPSPTTSTASTHSITAANSTTNEPLAISKKITHGTLANGLNYYILPNTEPPGRLTLRLLIRAGSLDETDDQRGIAHYLEHLAFNGTKNFPAGKMVEYFQKLGMAFGADTNAHTSFRETIYKLDLPNTEPTLRDDALTLMRDYADGMLLTAEEIKKERGIILRELNDRDTPDMRIFEAGLRAAFPTSTLANRMPIGIAPVINKLKREDFVDFYKKNYTPERINLIAVGDIDATELATEIEHKFADMPASGAPLPPANLGTFSQLEKNRVDLHNEPDASAFKINLTSIIPTAPEPDTVATRTRELQLALVADILKNRLARLSRTAGSSFSAPSTYLGKWFDFVEFADIELTTTAEKWQSTLTTADTELRRLREFGVTPTELKKALAETRKELDTAARQLTSTQSKKIANELADSLSEDRIYLLADEELALFDRIATGITPATLLTTLREIIHPTRLNITLAGNHEITNPEATVLSLLEKNSQQKITPTTERASDEFSHDPFGDSAEIIKNHKNAELAIEQISYANGVTANIKSADFVEKTVNIMIRFGDGLRDISTDNAYTPQWLARVFQVGGTTRHDTDALENILAASSYEIGRFRTDARSFIYTATCAAADIDFAMRFACAHIMQNGFRPEVDAKLRSELDQIYTALDTSLNHAFADRVDRFLAGGDTRFGFPPREQMTTAKLDDIATWYRAMITTAPIEINICGDIDPAAATAAISASFGSLTGEHRQLAADELQIALPEAPTAKKFTIESDQPSAIVLAAWRTDDMSNIHLSRRLNVLAEVLSDRMRLVIREQLGEAYSAYAYHNSRDDIDGYGYLSAIVACAPDKIEKVTAEVEKIATLLAEKGTDAEEISRALNPIHAQIKKQQRTYDYWLRNVLAASSVLPERLANASGLASDYQSITVEDIDTLAKKYLTKNNKIELVIQPRTAAEKSNQ